MISSVAIKLKARDVLIPVIFCSKTKYSNCRIKWNIEKWKSSKLETISNQRKIFLTNFNGILFISKESNAEMLVRVAFRLHERGFILVWKNQRCTMLWDTL